MPGSSNTGVIILGFGLAVGAVAVGVWGAKGSRGLNGFGRSRRGLRGHRTTRQLRGATEARELRLFIDNDGDLYRQQTTPIHKNLVTKIARGDYNATKAEKLWMYLVDAGAKKYAKDAGGGSWHDMFPISDRREVAKELNRHFLVEQKLGNYDHLLPKKYARS